jgi:hypothetical protein
MHCACGVNDTACILKNSNSSRIRIYIQKGFSPLSGAQDGCFDEKTEGRKPRDTVPLSLEKPSTVVRGLIRCLSSPILYSQHSYGVCPV